MRRIIGSILLLVALVAASGCGGNGAPTLVSLAVTPTSFDATAGGSEVLLTARATYSDGSVVDVTSQATWTTSEPDALDVSPGGSVSALAEARVGTTGSVGVAFDGQEATSTARVVRGPAIGVALSNDPLASQQWYLLNTGQNAFADVGGAVGEDLRVSSAYELGLTGRGVKVGIVDSGLEIGHPDLAANVVPGSWNFVTETDDPSPSPDPARPDGDHGTSVGGIIGMVYGNAVGGMGVAPGVSLNGYNVLENETLVGHVRSLGGSSENPRSDDVWIFNQSFGYDAPEPIAIKSVIEAQYESGVTRLRSGRGAVYVKAAGNGFEQVEGSNCTDARALGVSCQNANMDGEKASHYNIVTGALGANGKRSSYSTAGSALWVSAPGGEYGRNASLVGASLADVYYAPAIVTTDRTGCLAGYSRTGHGDSVFDEGAPPNGSCDYTSCFNGTSSSTPATVGAIALLLDARPDLTWRDVKHVLAMTARRVDPDVAPVTATLSDGIYTAELPWTRNAKGHWFHNWYGFGAVDVDAALTYARTLAAGSSGTLVDAGWTASSPALDIAIPDDSVTGATSRITVYRAITIESVQVDVVITHTAPGDLGIELTSPSGTRSILLNIRNGFGWAPSLRMTLASNAFYGEDSVGTWTLKVVDGRAPSAGTLDQWKIRVLGH